MPPSTYMEYPLLAIEHGGFTQMIPSADYWTALPIAFINLYRRRLTTMHFYDKKGGRWQLASIAPEQEVGPIRRVVGLWLGLSVKPVPVAADFRLVGPYNVEELRSDFRSAIEADDDILCQYHEKEQILAWLDDAKSVAKIFSLYNRIRKESRV